MYFTRDFRRERSFNCYLAVMKPTAAQIYRSDLRGKSQDESHSRLSVFNFDYYFDESRKPFGTLTALNEETLGPNHKVFRHIEADTEIVIVPLYGAVLYRDSLGNEDIVEMERIRVFSANAGTSYTLENPYGDDDVSYLQIWIASANDSGDASSAQQKLQSSGKNSIFPIFTGIDPDAQVLKIRQKASGHLGIFDKAQTGSYSLQNPENGLFGFVINGAFQFENQRIETRDGLSLVGIQSAEFEALSENSLLLIMEVPF